MPRPPKPLCRQLCHSCHQPTYRAPQAKRCLECLEKINRGNAWRDRQRDIHRVLHPLTRKAPGREIGWKRDLSPREIAKVIAQAEARMRWERLYGSREPDDVL